MISVDPVDYGLVVNAEDATDAAEVSAFEVEAHRLALHIVGVAERQGLGRIDALTGAALIASAAARGVPVGGLIFRGFAMRTLAHADSLQHN